MTTSRTGTNEWKKARARVLARSTVCHLCGLPGANEVDHVVPYSRGGGDNEENLRPAHRSCNRSKGARITGPVLPRTRAEVAVAMREWERTVGPSREW
ncbi:HNH endonuclease [Kineococcus rhizosphaerae]|uniref:HNH endonuclease n=1 Tax=Kineococcus rhizosphaerae TaxID=559628 RepID=A0A2T0QLU5_9ACTN|nr:HNH endonuclease signature motif containing protein [Kineococcus rhizosphaerae]PRY05393.1 HNH endonuclease [Kineococcus rhizosphaerae]